MATITANEFSALKLLLDDAFQTYVENYELQCRIGNYSRPKELMIMILSQYMYLINDYQLSDPTSINLLTAAQMDLVLRHTNILLNTPYDYTFQ